MHTTHCPQPAHLHTDCTASQEPMQLRGRASCGLLHDCTSHDCVHLLIQCDRYAMVVSAGLGAPLALLGCVVTPLLPCLLLLRHLDSPDVKRRLAFLYCSYRSVPADLRLGLLCAIRCCMYYIVLCSHLPGTVYQDQLLEVCASDQYLRMCAAA